MLRRPVAALAFGVTVALGLCHALCYSTMLPEEVTALFASMGLSARSMPRSAMIDLQLTAVIGLAALFAGAAGAVGKSPRRWFGMPHREWWLAPEREERTRADLAARVLWLGVCTQALVLALFHRTVRLNLGRAETVDGWYLDLVVFMAAASVWLALLRWRYRRPRLATNP